MHAVSESSFSITCAHRSHHCVPESNFLIRMGSSKPPKPPAPPPPSRSVCCEMIDQPFNQALRSNV
jgi:hypothetical protein